MPLFLLNRKQRSRPYGEINNCLSFKIGFEEAVLVPSGLTPEEIFPGPIFDAAELPIEFPIDFRRERWWKRLWRWIKGLFKNA